MRRIITTLSFVLASCASNSGIVPMGKDTYLLAKQQATGFPGLGNLKPEILQEANSFCGSKGSALQVVNVSETQPPYVLGNYPRVEVQFMCVSK